jgi:GNAT superfamily N-acetyltransferase
VPGDVASIEALVEAAYEKYVPRIGMRPVPMDDDYRGRVERGEAYVTGDGAIDGVLVLTTHDGYLLIDNVAVDPRLQGRRIGRSLLAFAEEQARELGLEELREIDVEGRSAVLMRKRLT